MCLHFFDGQGYSEEFVEALRRVVARARGGAPVEAVEAADDVCIMCPYLKGGLCASGEGADEEIRRMDAAALDLLGLEPGGRTAWAAIGVRLSGILPRWKEMYCRGCSWRRACEGNEAWRTAQ